ncbi:MAG: response regulator [Lachnospiraceae bacterium]|jgi:CheY-like chemotaxis protein|nr:response regulator [uncultured Acetatifactor sp.]MCI9221201.1 response regulator [Lachnospiraceae bacterium]
MRRILVVDDDKMNLRRTRLILEKYYDILTAESGQEALDMIYDEEIDLILLDIEMPGMSGIETFQRMKERGLDIPVIYLTASGYEEDVMNAIRLGAVNYLKKPFLPQDLMERIAKEFDKK